MENTANAMTNETNSTTTATTATAATSAFSPFIVLEAPVKDPGPNKVIYNAIGAQRTVEITNYPYGFKLRTSKFYWMEHKNRLGTRPVEQTRNPKTGKMNAAKAGVYREGLSVLVTDEKGYVSMKTFKLMDSQEHAKSVLLNRTVLDVAILDEFISKYGLGFDPATALESQRMRVYIIAREENARENDPRG